MIKKVGINPSKEVSEVDKLGVSATKLLNVGKSATITILPTMIAIPPPTIEAIAEVPFLHFCILFNRPFIVKCLIINKYINVCYLLPKEPIINKSATAPTIILIIRIVGIKPNKEIDDVDKLGVLATKLLKTGKIATIIIVPTIILIPPPTNKENLEIPFLHLYNLVKMPIISFK